MCVNILLWAKGWTPPQRRLNVRERGCAAEMNGGINALSEGVRRKRGSSWVDVWLNEGLEKWSGGVEGKQIKIIPVSSSHPKARCYVFSLPLESNKRPVRVDENIFVSVFYFSPIIEISRKRMKHRGSPEEFYHFEYILGKTSLKKKIHVPSHLSGSTLSLELFMSSSKDNKELTFRLIPSNVFQAAFKFA